MAPVRRERRVGVRYVENDRERDITFFKRRAGLFKSAADLSALTRAKVAVVLETDTSKMHSFGTPAVEPIIDAFLYGRPAAGPLTDAATSARISWLEREVARLDMENAAVEKKTKLSIQRSKQIEGQIVAGTTASFVSTKEKDLNPEDLSRLFVDLEAIQQEINRRLPPLQRGPEPPKGAGTSAPPRPLPSTGGYHPSQDQPPAPPLHASRQSSWSPLPPRWQSPSLAPLSQPRQSSWCPLAPPRQSPWSHVPDPPRQSSWSPLLPPQPPSSLFPVPPPQPLSSWSPLAPPPPPPALSLPAPPQPPPSWPPLAPQQPPPSWPPLAPQQPPLSWPPLAPQQPQQAWSPLAPQQPLAFPPAQGYAPSFPMENHITETRSGSNGEFSLPTLPSIPIPPSPPLPPSPLHPPPPQQVQVQMQDQPPSPLELHPHYYESPPPSMELPEIYPSPDQSPQQNTTNVASPLFATSGGDGFFAGDTFSGDHHWADTLSQQPYYSEILGFDDYTGYICTDGAGLVCEMENEAAWGEAPPTSGPSSGGEEGAGDK